MLLLVYVKVVALVKERDQNKQTLFESIHFLAKSVTIHTQNPSPNPNLSGSYLVFGFCGWVSHRFGTPNNYLSKPKGAED